MKEGRKGEDDSFYEKRGGSQTGGSLWKDRSHSGRMCCSIQAHPFVSLLLRSFSRRAHGLPLLPAQAHSSHFTFSSVHSLQGGNLSSAAAAEAPSTRRIRAQKAICIYVERGGKTINPISISSDSGGRHLQFVSVSSFKKRYPWRSRVLVVRIQRYAMLNELQHKS